MAQRSRIRYAEAMRVILRPARRPLLQLLGLVGILVSLPILVLGLFGHPRTDPQRVQYQMAVLQLRTLTDALQRYDSDCGRYPSAVEGLDKLVRGHGEPGWRGPYVPAVPNDPWRRPYIYDSSANVPKIISYGADGVPGGGHFDADLSSANLTFEIPETPQERRTQFLIVGVWCAALWVFGFAVYGLVRL